ncbi:AAA family ATPase [Clostridium butyricum]|uniref:AAA family ATPase n=1 Tax=Clostridium butyricum TaxID=1492 RepID=UPI0034654A18
MKPIKLKIKGLNSFQEEQSIDFLKLTDRGLFGIFGPTGSGKSTILDGITLALYGNMARKSSNFINTNCDRVNVSFEFQISGAEVKRYSIDREFRRKKDGSINSGKCKLIDINNEEVLADSVKVLNKKVEEIIGLNIDDFTRTVVLPQGKFSEFLKLEGKDRREMLERLFNLEKYGDELSVKLFSKIKEENTKSSVLEGQLKGYEDISHEKLEENEELLKNNMSEYIKLKEEFDAIEKQDRDNEELWNTQNELNKYMDKKKVLDEKFDFIEETKMKIKMGEGAEKVIPYITAYENTTSSYLENKLLLEELTVKIEDLSKKKEIIENKWIHVQNEKDEKLSGLLIDEQKVKDAIEDEKSLKIIEENLKESIYAKEKYKNKLNENEITFIELQRQIKEKNEYILSNEKKYEELKIDESFKEKVQDGLILEENISKVNNTLSQEEEKINKINILIHDTIREGKGLKESLQNIDNNLNQKKEKLDIIIKNCPGDQNILLERRKFIGECSLKYESYNRLTADINKFIEEKTILEKSIKEGEEILRIHESELKKLKENQNNAIRKSMATELRKELKDGELCPVCGSAHHHINDKVVFDEVKFDLELIEKDIKNKENIIKDINNDIIKDKTKLSVCIKNIEENTESINKLGDKFREVSIEILEENFEKLKTEIESYNKNKEELEVQINKAAVEREKQEGEIKALRSALRTYQNQLGTMEKELISIKNEKDVLDQKINTLKSEICVEQFKEKNSEIRKIEIERNNISNEISKIRKLLGNLEIEKEKCNKDIKALSEEIIKKETEINSYEKSKLEKIESIKNKAGNAESLKDLLREIEINIRNIKDNYIRVEKEKNEIEDIFNKYSEKLISSKSKEKTLSDKKETEKEQMKSAILREGFESINHVKNNILRKEELLELKEEVEVYKENISNIQGAIINLTNKIGGKSITKNQYEEHKILKASKNNELNTLNEFLIKLKDEIDRINEKLKEQKNLLEEKRILEHRLALLRDLEKLFKGKKFVEFVAGHQLKYISIEASKRLKEITHGTYGLEVDENGKFIIRDFKNGGAIRDASTLSGGETFLASLSLALALSAQIQLKGTAPLELFFLDEGFGTLDDNLLDVVMDSLERIHNDRLKVGIISHVESIKNRVPVKLIISPAECGNGGSKVKIERS